MVTIVRLHGGLLMHTLKSAFGIAALAGVVACYGGVPTSSSGGGSAYGYGPEEDGGVTGTAPMLALIDTGRTLNANPGQGVGVFVTYSAGGNWLIQWTCDTTITSESCPFQISAQVLQPSAAIKLANFVAGAGSSVSQSPSGCYEPAVPVNDAGSSCPPVTQLTAVATTTTDEDSLSFTTPPGATISVDVQLSGQPSSQYFFFVQNGQVNGGYTGPLSDPMEFEPTSP